MIVLLMLLAFISTPAYSFSIGEIKLNCEARSRCDVYQENIDNFSRSFNSEDDFNKRFADFISLFRDVRISYVSKGRDVEVTIKDLLLYKEVRIRNKTKTSITEVVGISDGDEYRPSALNETKERLKLFLASKGHKDIKIDDDVSVHNNLVTLVLSVYSDPPPRIEDIKFNIEDKIYKENLKSQLVGTVGKRWQPAEFEDELTKVTRSLNKEGFLLARVTLNAEKTIEKDKKVVPYVNVRLGRRFTFHVSGTQVLSQHEIKKSLREGVVRYNGELQVDNAKKTIDERYRRLGIFNSKIKISKKLYSKDGPNVFYKVYIKEGQRHYIDDIKFVGLSYFKRSDLLDLYYANASVIADNGFYDEEYAKNFVRVLEQNYYKNGFVFGKIVGPTLIETEDKTKFVLEYRLFESVQIKWGEFNFEGLNPALISDLEKVMNNKIGTPINVEILKEDIQNIIVHLRNNGFYNATISNLNAANVVTYDQQKNSATLNLNFNLGRLKKIRSVVFQGYERTNPVVLKREIDLEEGALLTPLTMQEIETKINQLGLFSTVNVKYETERENPNFVRVIVQVKERDYGYIDVAPGYRTDIGMKLSTSYGRQNLWGKNRSIVLKGQVNQRLDFDAFDQARKDADEKKLEYGLSLKFTEPYILNYPLAFTTVTSLTRKRFRSFDADISKINASLSKDITDWLDVSVKYQLEKIKQYDATDAADSGDFSVGAVTPSISFDFRDKKVNPTKGVIFKISSEFAKPYFLSRDGTTDIDYIKLISRNAAYVPFKNGVLALSLAGGVQINQTSENFIPRIKVFRLTGLDRVRGFDDEEINRVQDNDSGSTETVDINETFVNDRAYFLNAKIEPRFFLSDSIAFGPFLDAGRLYKDTFKPSKLRLSAGLSFKLITPVGSIDFDYGLKLRRRRVNNILESPGKFHISIGFF